MAESHPDPTLFANPSAQDHPAVLVVGHICLDLIPGLPSTPSLRPGHLQQIGPLAVRLGGCVANTGGDLAALGVRTVLGGDLGSDVLAEVLLRALEERGLDASGFRTVAGTTSYSIVVQPPGVDRTFWHHVGANAAFDGSDIAFGDAAVIHIGYPPLLPALVDNDGAPLEALLRRARTAGVTTSIDLAVVDAADEPNRARWNRILDRVLPFTDVISPSIDDLDSAIGADPVASPAGHTSAAALAAARALIDRGAAIAVVSAGSAGFGLATGSADRFATAGRQVAELAPAWHDAGLELPARPVTAIGTTGAGDAATAALLAAIVRGLDPTDALAFAADVAAAKVSGRPVATVLDRAGHR